MNAYATAERLQDLAEEKAQAQEQMAEGIYKDLCLYGEAHYWVDAKTKVKLANQPKVLETVSFSDLFEHFEDDLEPFLKTVFLGSAEESLNIISLKRRMNEKARELANQIAEECFS